MNLCITALMLLLAAISHSQTTDTITFYSKAFQQERTIYVQTPEFYKYQSELVKLPVYYILDGQHEWFAKPVATTINNLIHTHEIPHGIVVSIPLNDRVKECGILSLEGTPLPLHMFITEEIPQAINAYNPGEINVLIGHSFSASFALYSYLLKPDFYTGVLANSPLDEMEMLILGFNKNKALNLSKIFLSVGSMEPSKDINHRKKYEEMKQKYPGFYQTIQTYEANTSAHNAVPLVAVPKFLSDLFASYSVRYDTIAEVNESYQLINKPNPVEAELKLIQGASVFHDKSLSMEVPDINGIASRYVYSDYTNHGIALYELGISLYPNYYDFYFSLGNLYANIDKEKALSFLNRSLELLDEFERNWEYKQEVVYEIEEMKNTVGL